MEKRVIALVSALALFLAPSEPLRAQQSMLDGDPVWVYRQSIGTTIKNAPKEVGRFDDEPLFYHIYYIKGDTTIQNRVYKKLYHEYLNEKGKYAFDTQGVELVTPLREEGNKILAPRSYYQKLWGDADWYYEIVGSTDDEIVVYDFDAFKEGTISIQQKGQIFAQSIGNFSNQRMVDKSYRQEYTLGDDGQALQIIDGIGCWKNNVLLFAPFADDSFLVPEEAETEMWYRTINDGRDNYLIIWISEDASTGMVVGNYDESFFDSSWVTKTDDGKMMVTAKKISTESQLCYYVQDGKIVFNSTDAKHYDSGYDFVEKYLNYHINDEEEMVDLGLSVKWSTHNLGASSPTDFGQYYFWGDTVGIRRPINNDERVPYSGQYTEFESRLQSHIAKTRYDAAYQLQGKNWRMPTVADFQELMNKCSCVRIYVNDVCGFLFIGPNGNTLFLPEAEGLQPRYPNVSNLSSGMMFNDNDSFKAVYWTDELLNNSNIYVYDDNRITSKERSWRNAYYHYALPIRAVYDESGDKWLSVNEYLYYDRYDYIDWGWNEDDIVIPTLETCNAFITRYQKLFGADNMIYQKIVHKTFCDHFRQYVSTRLDDYKARAIETYEGSDGKTLYFVDKIDDDFLNTFEGQSGQINLLSAINLEEDAHGAVYTKNCTYTVENLDPKFGVPGNQYLRVRPTSQSAQPFIAFNLPVLMANTNYTLRITMAPETVDSIAPLGNQFRINMFIKTPEGQWPKTRNYVCKNPLDPTGKTLNFTSSADTLTVIDLPLTLDYATDVMVQLQSYVSTKETATYTRTLRIANIEVINNGREYAPFIADNKVWKVGNTQTILNNSVQVVDYYYFDGDTIIDGKTCKQMMCQRYVSPGYSNEYWTPKPFLSKVGAWYEEDQKVYFYDERQQSMSMKYDFSLAANDTLKFLTDWSSPFIIGPKQTGGIEGFKGVYRDIRMCGDEGQSYHDTFWLEGVGCLRGPISNPCDPILGDPMPEFLMSCTVGDEVIYLNDEVEEGCMTELPTGDSYAKKRRFDFTHTVKTQPKTPQRRGEEAALYGEYNDKSLDINLKMLNTAYMVRITNQKTGEVVYEKAVNAGSIVALDIDISAYPKGQYAITVENSNEVFNGVIDTSATGIEEIIHNSQFIMHNDAILNLQGQRIKTLQKGLNIVNGKKVWVK